MYLLLFDVDGTISHPQKPVFDEIRQVLRKLASLYPTLVTTGFVSGSGPDKITRQVGVERTADLLRSSEHPNSCHINYMFYENGLLSFSEGHDRQLKELSRLSIRDHLGDANYVALVNGILFEFSQIQLPVKTSQFVELRTGTLNVSPIGRACTYAERDAFAVLDKEQGIRLKLQKRLSEQFSASMDLVFAIGGQISLDIYPRGWDKSFCLGLMKLDQFNEIHFFGDRCSEGGNDHGIYIDERVTHRHAVDGPEKTLGILRSLLKRLQGESLSAEESALLAGDPMLVERLEEK
eukprot:Protomagalhaensia_wolfi_Nauph_80__1973@NODE_2247_length_1154_cov_20_425112_g1753_i0_p1_GENE_NODE_2247_length_1154_cov_20_425112_g1753_i0NODE_2247_length_1154_cov_20_425112_g1753_i0_p1_ORF_typecomplete_len293_score44_82PMM/PF03332_13/2_6e56Hydrolase_3/PF08282_12/0_0037SOCS_box/PF07525_16/0_074Trehalose_PPase/PF02358_16/0_34Trehalose_PPase/PF02358_16/2_2e03_NODE_2247_length_1154_cov_20_425112_g1753_i02351113